MPMISSCSFFQQVELMDPQKTDLKHTDNYLCSENNSSTSYLAVSDGSKFPKITFRCVEIEVKNDFKELLGRNVCYQQA